MSARFKSVGAKPGPKTTRPRRCYHPIRVGALVSRCNDPVAAKGLCVGHLNDREARALANRKHQVRNPLKNYWRNAYPSGRQRRRARKAFARAGG